jgi:hypothetical protein
VETRGIRFFCVCPVWTVGVTRVPRWCRHALRRASAGGMPRDKVTIEVIFDDPHHVRVEDNDDEIINRALSLQQTRAAADHASAERWQRFIATRAAAGTGDAAAGRRPRVRPSGVPPADAP